MTESAFETFRAEAWPYRFHGTLKIERVAGGTPTDPKVAENWLRAKLGTTSEELLRRQVAEVILARKGEISREEAEAEVLANRHLNGFKRMTDTGELHLEGRHLKAAIKEAASVALAADKLKKGGWGKTNKGLLSFLAEHVCVMERDLPLGVKEPSGINQRFVHTFRGSGIQYEEYVDGAEVDFTITTDYDFEHHTWAMIWLKGEQQGIGATRSQGYGRYTVTRWEADHA
jgi:hypothetical protein